MKVQTQSFFNLSLEEFNLIDKVQSLLIELEDENIYPPEKDEIQKMYDEYCDGVFANRRALPTAIDFLGTILANAKIEK